MHNRRTFNPVHGESQHSRGQGRWDGGDVHEARMIDQTCIHHGGGELTGLSGVKFVVRVRLSMAKRLAGSWVLSELELRVRVRRVFEVLLSLRAEVDGTSKVVRCVAAERRAVDVEEVATFEGSSDSVEAVEFKGGAQYTKFG